MKIGPGVSELWGVENRPLPLTRPMAYTTACTTVQAVIADNASLLTRKRLVRYNFCQSFSEHLHSIRVENINWVYTFLAHSKHIFILDPKCLIHFSAELS